jgi:hypothetical protein
LLLLYIEHPETFTQGLTPEWAEETLSEDDDAVWLGPEATNEQDDKRRQRIETGLEELGRWLTDLVRNGLEVARSRPALYYQAMAERLTDAQLGEVAKDVRQLATMSNKNPRWHEEMLGSLGRLQLLIEGFRRFDSLPEEIKADLRLALGWLPPLAKDALTITDHWHVLGRRVEQEVGRKVQRIWLWGETSGQAALLVNVLHGKKTATTRLLAGGVLEATLGFYPSSTPLRAEIIAWQGIHQPRERVKGMSSIQTVLATINDKTTKNPWLRTHPLLLESVIAEQLEQQWILRDKEGYLLTLPPRYTHGWTLRAMSADRLWLFGEYDGSRFLPLSTWAQGRLLELHTLRGIS